MTRNLSFTHLWIAHGICCLLAVLSCIPILWPQVFLPDAWEARIISYSGWVLMLSFGVSALLIIISSFLLLLRLRNMLTIWHLIIWLTLWLLSALIFCIFAWVANVPSADEDKEDAELIQRTDKLHMPEETLNGPYALCIPIDLASYSTDTLVHALNLSLLDKKHNELLRSYVDTSPRWASYTRDDTFYTKPGHVVMTPPATEGIQGLVHAAFRRLIEGEPLPNGYTIVKPGDPMPPTPEGSEQVPDLAVDLGGSHYLLLVWRGSPHAETAHRALNAALAAVDDMVSRLADNPTETTLQRILVGKRNITGSTAVMLLSQPPSQYGAYQAEVYTNPNEPGTLMLRIADMEDGATLRLFSCPAQFSANPDELFRHDFPGLMPELMRAFSVGHVPGIMPPKAPLFIVRTGESHQFFGVACEIVFDPSTPGKPRRTLLRRCYRVQAYEDPNAPDEPEAPEPSTPADTSPKSTSPEPPAAPTPKPTTPPAPEQAPSAPTPPVLKPGLPIEKDIPAHLQDTFPAPTFHLNPLTSSPAAQ